MSKGVFGIIVVFLIVWGFPVWVMTIFPDLRWSFEQSPNTGQCYETFEAPAAIGRSISISPVDDSYFEEAMP